MVKKTIIVEEILKWQNFFFYIISTVYQIERPVKAKWILNLVQFWICSAKVHLKNGWNSKRMITEGDAAIPLETTWRAFGNQMKSKQTSTFLKILKESVLFKRCFI